VIDGYTYDVFGAIRSQSGANDWLFTGGQSDGDEGLYYLRARYYDPQIGRFLSQDPLPGGNLYAYVGNNPVNATDRSGLSSVGVGGGVLEPCAPFDPTCIGSGGGGGGGGIIIIGGVVYVVTATGAVAVGTVEEIGSGIGGLAEDAWGGVTSLFSGKGKSEKSRIGSITTMSAAIRSDLCRLPGLRDKSSVQSDIRKRIKNIQNEYRHLGPTAKRKAERIFKDAVWNNPCDPQPSTVFPPIFGDGSAGGGKE
jgi:RHS repeat-associated protein